MEQTIRSKFNEARKSKNELMRKTYESVIAKIMAILCVLISVYNSSLRTEAGYMAYFILAIPMVIQKEQKNAQRWELYGKTNAPEYHIG